MRETDGKNEKKNNARQQAKTVDFKESSKEISMVFDLELTEGHCRLVKLTSSVGGFNA